ncbi:MAG: type II secretion system F family protein [Candidatus Thorarchaeota archaeon]
MIYERLCNGSRRIPPFSQIAERKKNRELEKAIQFLAPLMVIDGQGVYAAAYLVSTLMPLAIIPILAILNLSILLIIPLTLILTVLVYYAISTYPVSVMNGYKLTLSEESDIVFEQFVLVFQSGGTIFDAIEMVANSEHPYLSKAFQKMLVQIRDGVPPETCLSEFAKTQPSDDLRRYFTGILSSLERKTDLLEMLSGESFEADLTLRQKNLELESRLLIVTALATYIPIILTLGISLGGYATDPVVLLAAPVFIIISALLKSRFSNQFSAYFDRPQNTGITAPSQQDIIAEYDEFLNFLMLLGEKLHIGDTLEVALQGVRDDVAPEIQRLIDPAINEVFSGEKGIDEAMKITAGLALGERVAHMMNLINIMCEASAVEAGDRLTKIAGRLIKRSAVAKERDSIIAAQRLKVYLLVITSSVVLGFLASLSPFLFIGSLLTQGPTWDPSSVTVFDILPLFIMLLVTTISNGYQNTIMVNGRRPVVMGVFCGLLFWIAFVMASSILGVS